MELLDLYHRLPYPARCLAASWRGSQLARRRYGRETPRLVKEALERDTWPADRWKTWREEKLHRLLQRAVTQVPFYRDLWSRRRAAGDPRRWERLEHWPVLSKETLRRQPRAFLADDCSPRSMVSEHTSGSTGSPLQLWRSQRTNIAWYALVEARLRSWHGVHLGEPWALLGGQLVAPVDSHDPPYWVWARSQRQLYLSAYHLAPGTAGAYCNALRQHGVRSLLGYPSGLATLASLALEEGAQPPPLQVVLSNAEPLFDHQRQVLEKAFAAPVRDTYGLAEMTVSASECPQGGLHLWPEVGVLELLMDDEDAPVPHGTTGRVVTTGLLNQDMPLIRYEVGDRARAPSASDSASASCSCGRTLPLLAAVEGRLDDVIVTPDGRRVGRLDPVFKGDLAIREAQIVQTAEDRVVVRIVPAAGFTAAAAEDVARRLHQRLGSEMQVTTESVASLPRTDRGKVRAVVSLDRSSRDRSSRDRSSRDRRSP